MAEIQVRPAVPEDAVAIADLLQAMGLPSSAGHIRTRIEAAAGADNEAVLVANSLDGMAGFAALACAAIFHEPGQIGRIKALSVVPGQRREGVGTALIQAAIGFFKSQGCIRMEVTSGESRHAAHAFYQACGMQADLRRFVMHLD